MRQVKAARIRMQLFPARLHEGSRQCDRSFERFAPLCENRSTRQDEIVVGIMSALPQCRRVGPHGNIRRSDAFGFSLLERDWEMRIESLQGTEGFIRTPQDALTLQIPPDFIETLPIAIYACDAQGRLLWFNKRAAHLWGRTPLLGSDSELYCGSHRLYLDGREIARAQTPMAAVLRTGIPVRGVEGKLERPDGTAIWVMVHIEPIEDEDGRVVGAINCFHDVTDRRLSDEIIGQQEQRLAACGDWHR
ncbi:PAS domain-containing protein [Mesorhizobium sp.]|uniref:PAS domain-containing protein n=1 Tax=Mesorhizobium sp. TaxID=1871066 RepID=UPI000FE600AF|nr:PAS domain-containing protein [Mesorhizobium sp.]RWG04273.1 MAG: PAS domain-containing protein [Mesorhizobium sp.]RWG95735.1 MAG: PAS domain-containing protein [Mesorhizobium sp.]TIN35266.1 MAG: PAS domain-containing protein [Mesorhizobium sp.]TIR94164.1 MAG: PAS domain-containing protein [Mesorhizobium sp.]TIS01335.1 MAG: PAS domain-containing protein [Mesorhizobium sp.]